MKDSAITTRKRIYRTVIFLVLLTVVILCLFVYTVIRQGGSW